MRPPIRSKRSPPIPADGLGGKLGFTAVLHTWNQQLRDHFHLHCLVPAGALAPDRSRWIHAHNAFLFPVKALSKVFRGKFIASLNQAFTGGRLRFLGTAAPLGTPAGFGQLISSLWKKPWVVYAKKPFAGPNTVLDYLGRYTHRVAIDNHRITRIHHGSVSFTYRDRTDRNQKKTLTLPAPEFIRRFLLHVLPKGYVRIRHFGFLASRAKGKDLPRCRELLGMPPQTPPPAARPTRHALLELLGLDFTTCPHCQRGTMHRVADLPPLDRRRNAETRGLPSQTRYLTRNPMPICPFWLLAEPPRPLLRHLPRFNGRHPASHAPRSFTGPLNSADPPPTSAPRCSLHQPPCTITLLRRPFQSP